MPDTIDYENLSAKEKRNKLLDPPSATNHKCSQCDRTMDSKDYLKIHYQACHTNIPVRTNGFVAGHAATTVAAPQVLSPTTTSLDISPAPKTSEEENGYQLLFLSARACSSLSDQKVIKALLPPDYSPFYVGFWNRDTDELSDRKIGIPKGKNFIINPKGKVAINHQIDVKSFTSLHTLVNDMFPHPFMVEQVLLTVNSFKIYQ
ncbi:hypothetical protein H5410_044860 [Solanum commersonii]|uniref:C2H2-type domain-containing protein n=1 Tax=Solanum commersonii TaxID=4109 RepID=A0A9J5X9C2_SOLCO|nr:hypothetical protein H5410_044860 [Solanum commersonii]